MDDRTKHLLSRVLDMSETEMRAALIAAVNGIPLDQAIDEAFNVFRRQAMKFRRLPRPPDRPGP